MNTQIINSKLFSKLKDKKYRDLFIADQINVGIPFQMRALRAAHKMTQKDLAEKAGTKQTAISRIENKGASNLSIQVLLKLASAFDVGLVVRFEPIDKLIEWVAGLSPEVMCPESSETILEGVKNRDDCSSTSDNVNLSTKSSAIEKASLRLLPPTTTAVSTRTRAHRTANSPLPLFDRPLGIVGHQTVATMEKSSSTTVAQGIPLTQATTTTHSSLIVRKTA